MHPSPSTPLPASANPAAYAALVLRIALGVMSIAHALLKIFVFTVPGTVHFFASVGFPGALAYAVIAVELGGGILLVLGIGARAAAAALVPVLLGATMVHAGNGWVFNAAGGGWEYPVFLTLAAIAQILLGNGAFALGSVLAGSSATPRLQRTAAA